MANHDFQPFLESLKKDLCPIVPDEEITAILADAEAHLTDLQNRFIADGSPPQEAATLALLEFGSPQDLTSDYQEQADQRTQKRLRKRLLIVSAITGAYWGLLQFEDVSIWLTAWNLTYLVMGFLLLQVLIASALLRKIQFIPPFVTTLVLIALSFCHYTTSFAPYKDGHIERSAIQNALRQNHTLIPVQHEYEPEFYWAKNADLGTPGSLSHQELVALDQAPPFSCWRLGIRVFALFPYAFVGFLLVYLIGWLSGFIIRTLKQKHPRDSTRTT